MKPSTRAAIGLTLFLACAPACSVVQTTFLVGDPITEDLSEAIDGVWAASEKEVYHVKFAGGGRVDIAKVKWSDDGFEVEQANAWMTSLNDVNYLLLQDPDGPDADDEDVGGDESPPNVYMLTRYVFAQDDSIVLYAPQHEVFSQAVEDGQLEGEIESAEYSKNVTIRGDRAALEAFLTAEDFAKQFHVDKPIVLRRISK